MIYREEYSPEAYCSTYKIKEDIEFFAKHEVPICQIPILCILQVSPHPFHPQRTQANSPI